MLGQRVTVARLRKCFSLTGGVVQTPEEKKKRMHVITLTLRKHGLVGRCETGGRNRGASRLRVGLLHSYK